MVNRPIISNARSSLAHVDPPAAPRRHLAEDEHRKNFPPGGEI